MKTTKSSSRPPLPNRNAQISLAIYLSITSICAIALGCSENLVSGWMAQAQTKVLGSANTILTASATFGIVFLLSLIPFGLAEKLIPWWRFSKPLPVRTPPGPVPATSKPLPKVPATSTAALPADKESSDAKLSKRAHWQAEVGDYFREQKIESTLAEGHFPFAVISVRQCHEEARQQLAQELTKWSTENGGAKILGLQHMLEGKQPEVAAHLFCMPILLGTSDRTQWTKEVALVGLPSSHTALEAKLTASLSRVIERHKPASLWSYDEYCYEGR